MTIRSVRIPDSLDRRLSAQAKLEDRSINKTVLRALEEYLDCAPGATPPARQVQPNFKGRTK